MSMILPLLRKDFRRLSVLLAFWLLLLALDCALSAWGSRPTDLTQQVLYLVISILVPLSQLILLNVIIPHLVQEDPLVGTTGFWLTRPISRGQLLQSKALFCALLATLVLVAQLAVLATHGVTGQDLGLAAAEILLSELSILVTIVAVAVLTPTFARFVVAIVVLIATSALIGIGIAALHHTLRPGYVSDAANGLLRSRAVAESLLVVIGGIAVIVHQYLTRRTGRSIAIGVVTLAGGFAVLGCWPWDFLAPAPLPGSGTKFDAASVRLSLGHNLVQEQNPFRALGNPSRTIDAEIDVAGLPPGEVGLPERVQPQLSQSDGTPVKVQEPLVAAPINLPPNLDALEYALGGTPLVNGGLPFPRPVGLLKIDAAAYDQFAAQPLKFTAQVNLVASRYQVITTLPIVRGARYDQGSEHLVITEVLPQGNAVAITLHESNVRLLLDRTERAANPAAMMINGGNAIYVLRNKKTNEAVLQTQVIGLDLSSLIAAVAHRLIQRTVQLSFGPEPDRNRFTPDLTAAWLADAELVRVELVPVARFTAPLAAEDLRLATSLNHIPVRPPTKPFDRADLAKITLPPQPSPAQVREYIAALDEIATPPNPATSELLTGKYLQVGVGNLGALIDAAADRNGNFFSASYLNGAVDRLARPADKALILRNLAADHALADLVLRYGWATEARPTLLLLLADPTQEYLPGSWIQAVATLQDPATYPDLEAYLVRGVNRQQTFNAIRRLPGIDLGKSVALAWTKAKYAQPSLVVDALRHGLRIRSPRRPGRGGGRAEGRRRGTGPVASRREYREAPPSRHRQRRRPRRVVRHESGSPGVRRPAEEIRASFRRRPRSPDLKSPRLRPT